MRKTIFLIAATLICSGIGPAQATGAAHTVPQRAATSHARNLTVERVAYIERPGADNRVAGCTKTAAVRALNAKAVGASYAAQDRVLELAFMLCMTGPQSAD